SGKGRVGEKGRSWGGAGYLKKKKKKKEEVSWRGKIQDRAEKTTRTWELRTRTGTGRGAKEGSTQSRIVSQQRETGVVTAVRRVHRDDGARYVETWSLRCHPLRAHLSAVLRGYRRSRPHGASGAPSAAAYSAIRLSFFVFFFSSRRRHTRLVSDWSSDVCSSD